MLENGRFSESKEFELMKKLDEIHGRTKYLNVIEKLNLPVIFPINSYIPTRANNPTA